MNPVLTSAEHNVGLLLICHDSVGAALLAAAQATLDQVPLPVATLAATRDCNPAALLEQARDLIAHLDRGGGVLVLTDLFGSTPSNVAARLLATGRVRVVTGMNLPMLIRVLNYPCLTLDALAAKALSGGQDGVVQVGREVG
jgi:PTS system ascorbate-specific IIA component